MQMDSGGVGTPLGANLWRLLLPDQIRSTSIDKTFLSDLHTILKYEGSESDQIRSTSIDKTFIIGSPHNLKI